MPKRLVVLGSTGSIGRQCLEIVRSLPGRFEVVGLAGGANVDLLLEQAERFRPRFISSPGLEGTIVGDWGCRLVPMTEMVADSTVDLVVVATVGGVGLMPTLAAIRAGKTVALANKEVLVMAGEIIAAEASARGVAIWPVDSEHSAIWQCLEGEEPLTPQDSLARRWPAVARVVLTASGGAFRDLGPDQLAAVTAAEALRHPTWVMGPKVTIDSATLLNKGLEVIEAHWLFGLPYDQIDVLIHRESIVHSLVEFVDGSIKAQLGVADMRLPIQYALTYPERLPSQSERLDLVALGRLTFESLDENRYPCFALAMEAARAGGTYPAALSGADEAAVGLFLDGQISYLDIPRLIESALSAHRSSKDPDLQAVLAAAGEAAAHCRQLAYQVTGR